MGDSTLLNLLWVEKYRPKKIEDMILDDSVKEFMLQALKEKNIPHLLFIGPPGSGKTSLAKIIIDHFLADNVLILNGSSETGIDVVRDKIESFLSVKGFNDELKIVFIDEFDYMSQNAQACIRNVMDHYISVGRFLCTANFHHKIIEPLISRFQIYRFETLPISIVEEHVFDILSKEQVSYNTHEVKEIIHYYYPDVRQIINVLNSLCVNKKIQISNNKISNDWNRKLSEMVIDLFECLQKSKNMDEFKKRMLKLEEFIISNANRFQFPYVYEYIFRKFNNPIVKITVVDYLEKDKKCLFPYINFIAFLWNVYINFQKMSSLYNIN